MNGEHVWKVGEIRYDEISKCIETIQTCCVSREYIEFQLKEKNRLCHSFFQNNKKIVIGKEKK